MLQKWGNSFQVHCTKKSTYFPGEPMKDGIMITMMAFAKQ